MADGNNQESPKHRGSFGLNQTLNITELILPKEHL